MSFFFAFARNAPNTVFLSIALGILAGISYALLIPIVVISLSGADNGLASTTPDVRSIFSLEVSNVSIALVFFSLCLFALVSRAASRIILIRLAMNHSADLRLRLCKTVRDAPYILLETLGPARLTAILTEDVRRILIGGQLLPDLLISLVMLVSMLGFLLALSSAAFKFVMEAILFGVITYQVPNYFASKALAKARRIFDELQEAIRGLIYGIKELKMDARKQGNYFSDVLSARENRLLESEKFAFTTFIAATTYGDLLGFFVIGVIAFVFVNYHSVDSNDLIGIVMALLYVTGPIALILNVIPQMAQATSAVRNIERVFGEISAEGRPDTPMPITAWQRLTISGVTFERNNGEGSERFSIGPINCEIDRGEITFIVGGNGSGKSTLGKIISLYYVPGTGTIQFGENSVTDMSRVALREEVSAVFSDYFLFDRLLGEVDQRRIELANAYLVDFGLNDKIHIADGGFSTLGLSDGQRKRLALLIALIDDKNLYIFDEWAADQDPSFKHVFYRKILPDLKSQGKAVVVISHDDRYFDVADKILEMENGSLRKFVRRKQLGVVTDIL
jgi:putative ATP-binding cassette transporter